MLTQGTEGSNRSSWALVAASGLRAAFGVIWAVDAYLKLQPAFAQHYVGVINVTP